MKKICSLLLVLSLTVSMVSAQTRDNKIALGINYVKNEYRGDYGNDIFKFDKFYNAFGLSLSGYLNRSFDLGIQGSFGHYGYWADDQNHFLGKKLDASLFLRYKLNNGYILSETSKLAPFISLGGGMASYHLANKPAQYPAIIIAKPDWIIPMSVGLKYQFTPGFAIQYQYVYNYTTSDSHDQNRGDNYNFFGTSRYPHSQKGKDLYGQHVFGIVIGLSKAKDEDKDGVADKWDACPSTPAGVAVDKKGCPLDGDGDGVADYMDKCPDVAGVAKFDGCPDTDGDGVQDSEDKCPNVAGLAKFQGCPDTDGDGVQDSEDKCPTVAGLAKFQGCPDTDGDGVQDSEDKCPNTPKGVKVDAKGCPVDTDGDGVPDYMDKCPTVAGVAANKGCPEVKAEHKKVFEQALTGIQFESGKNVIKKTSNSVLDKIVTIMKENPSYLLEINGHTDSQGDEGKNLVLSQNRANAVKAYFAAKGVDPERMTSTGFGESVPVADNKTAAGRAKNRRVEFKVKF